MAQQPHTRLLQQDRFGGELVLEYNTAEMLELFTQEQRDALDRGEVVPHRWPLGRSYLSDEVRLVDMQMAARAVLGRPA